MGDDQRATSLHDIYTAINDTRKELTGELSKLADQVNAVTTAHEHRLTTVEQSLASLHEASVLRDQRIDAHGFDIGALKDRQREDEAATKALQSAEARKASRRRWLVGTGIAVASMVALCVGVVIPLLHK